MTPLELRDLPFGPYEVRLEQRGFEPQSQMVSLDEQNAVARLSANLVRRTAVTGSAAITSTPPGADVTVDGRRAGRTPLARLALAPGSHRLTLVLAGHESWSGSVDVLAGQRAKVDVRLQPIPKPWLPPPCPPRPPSPTVCTRPTRSTPLPGRSRAPRGPIRTELRG